MRALIIGCLVVATCATSLEAARAQGSGDSKPAPVPGLASEPAKQPAAEPLGGNYAGLPGQKQREQDLQTRHPKTEKVEGGQVVEQSESTRLLKQADGSYVYEAAAAPVRVKVGDEWKDIDLKLEDTTDGRLAPRQPLVPISIAKDSSDPELARVDTDQGPIVLSADSVDPHATGKRSKETAKFDASDPARPDFEISSARRGLETTYVVNSSGELNAQIVEHLKLPGSWSATQDGANIVITDNHGDPRFVWGDGLATDSADSPSRGPVAMRLLDSEHGRISAAVEPNADWLQSGLTYPLYIDPVLQTYSTNINQNFAGDVNIFEGTPTYYDNQGQAQLKNLYVGRNATGSDVGRSLLTFVLNSPGSIPSDADVSDAWVTLTPNPNNNPAGYCVEGESAMRPNLQTWTYGVSWNTAPPVDTAYASESVEHCNAGKSEYHMPSIVDKWVGDYYNLATGPRQQNFGVTLYDLADRDIQVADTERSFYSGESTTGAIPTLTVKYDRTPQPIAMSGCCEQTLTTLQPTLTASAAGADPDGDTPVQYLFEVSTSPYVGQGAVVTSPWLGSPGPWTVPAGSLLDGGTYYARAYTAAFPTGGTPVGISRPSPDLTLHINQRLGAGGPSPYDSISGVTTNLATGNATFSVAGASLPTPTDALGTSFTYNSKAAPKSGLTGHYLNSLGYEVLTKRDAQINFNWGAGYPTPALEANTTTPGDNFKIKWDGFVTIPDDTGGATQWQFGTIADNRASVNVAGTQVITDDTDHPPPATATWGNPITLSSGHTYPIHIDYSESTYDASVQLWVRQGTSGSGQVVPASWFGDYSPLPTGWSTANDLGAGVDWVSLTENGSSVVLNGVDGDTTTFTLKDGGYVPQAGEDGVLSRNRDDGALTYDSPDGRTYTFTIAGQLNTVTSAEDDLKTGALRYTFSSPSSGAAVRLTRVTDPISNRGIDFAYNDHATGNPGCSTDVPDGRSDLYRGPTGALCRVTFAGIDLERLWYDSSNIGAQLRMIENRYSYFANDADIWEFGYSGGLVNTIRTPLHRDAIVANASVASKALTTIAYSGGKVASVQSPTPQVAAAAKHIYTYGTSSTTVKEQDGATTPTIRTVTWDAAGRLLTDTDAAGVLTTTNTWNGNDQLLSTVDAAGFKTTTHYDYAKRPDATYGPAVSSCFGTNNLPNGTCTGSNSVATSTTEYDGGSNPIHGLAAAYWPNQKLSGAPALHATGVNPYGSLVVDWGQGAPSTSNGLTLKDVNGNTKSDDWSARFTGEVQLDQVGLYKFYAWSDDGVRIFVDDTLVVDHWAVQSYSPSGTLRYFSNTTAGSRHRIRVEYFDQSQNAHLEMSWVRPDGVGENVPGSALYPRYGLVTATTDPDLHRTTTTYAEPETALATAVTTNPSSGKYLTTQTGYETRGASGGFARKTTRTLPLGGQTVYRYFDSGTPKSNSTCSTAYGDTEFGMLRSMTTSSNSGSPITKYFAYDLFGRLAGTRINNDSWACYTYDNRGRPQSQTDSSGKTMTTTYSSNATTPMLTTVNYRDSANDPRITKTETDLLGRSYGYTDELGTRTETLFDQPGRVAGTTRQFSGQAVQTLSSNSYNTTTRRLDSTTDNSGPTPRTTSFTYDTYGRPSTTTLQNGVKTTTGYDPVRGGVSSLSYGNTSNASAFDNVAYTRTAAGDVKTETGTGRNRTYTYDGANRLTRVQDGASNRYYAYDDNSNRCGTANSTSCDGAWSYDGADHMTASPFGSEYQYDPHGNLYSYRMPTASSTASINDSFAFASNDPPHDTSIHVGSGGSVNATIAWSSDAVVRTSSSTGSLTPRSQPNWYAFGDTPKPANTAYLTSTFTYPQDLAVVDQPTYSGSLNPGATLTKAFTTAAAGAFHANVNWATTQQPYAASGSVGTATTVAAPSFTTSANGSIQLKLTWKSSLGACQGVGTAGPPPKLDIVLNRTVGGSNTQVAATNTALNQNTVTLTYNVSENSSLPSSTTFTPSVKSTTTGCAWTLTGTYPVTDSMTAGLFTSGGAPVQTIPTTAGVPGGAISIASLPQGSYEIRVTAGSFGSPYVSIDEAHALYSYADVTLELHKPGGTTVQTWPASSGVAQGAYETNEPGAWYWTVGNNSSSVAVPTYTWSRTTENLASGNGNPISTPVAIAATTKTFADFHADAAGPVHVIAGWKPSTATADIATKGYATLTWELRDQITNSLIGSGPTTSSGTVDFTLTAPAAGDYKVTYRYPAADKVSMTSGTNTISYPYQYLASVTPLLVDANGNTVATPTYGSNSATLSASNLSKGTYRIRAWTSNSGNATVTGTYTNGDTYATFGYDANDHATTIDEGTRTIDETLDPSGRVLRRKVYANDTGFLVQDTDYGYDDAGDSPAYSGPHPGSSGGNRTYVTIGGGMSAIDVSGTVSYQHANLHGDIIGTSDANGVWTAAPLADEYGVGVTPSSRYGWLGSQQRATAASNLGIVRMGVRLYDPSVGRFLEADPVDGGSANSYDYVGGDPENAYDLAGTCSMHNRGLGAKQRDAICLATMLASAAGRAALRAGKAAAKRAVRVGKAAYKIGKPIVNGVRGCLKGYKWGMAGGTLLGAGAAFLVGPEAIPIGSAFGAGAGCVGGAIYMIYKPYGADNIPDFPV